MRHLSIYLLIQYYRWLGSIVLTDTDSMNIIMTIWLVSMALILIISVGLVILVLSREKSIFNLLSWYLTTGGLTLWVLIGILFFIWTENDLDLARISFSVILWPIIDAISPVGWYLRGSEGSSTPLVAVDYWNYLALTLLPQYTSLLLVNINKIYAGFKKRGKKISQDISRNEENIK